VIRRFLLCPLLIGAFLTAALLISRTYQFSTIARALWFVAAPPLVVSLRFPSTPLFFAAAVCWAAILFSPYWASFRVGRFSALATQAVILLAAAALTGICFVLALAGFPTPP
jgi:hypothetical protein